MKLPSLKERIKIQSPAYVSDQLGGYHISWADKSEIWAEISPLKIQKTGEESGPVQFYHVLWRWGTKVSYQSRLQWGKRYLRFVTRPQHDVCRRWVSAIAKLSDGGEDE